MTKTTHNKKHLSAQFQQESWMSRTWRPAMAMTYMSICICDFIIFPILYGLYSFHFKDTSIQAWVPLTLQGGGMLHLAMGTVLGITSYTKGATQTAMVNNGMNPNVIVSPVDASSTQVDTSTPTTPIKSPVPRIKA